MAIDPRLELLKTLRAVPVVTAALISLFEHGRMTVERYATHIAAEDVDHLAQIARLRA